jgi:GT2 family glycosyltransferase
MRDRPERLPTTKIILMKLSIIIATRNRAHAIGRCLDSAAASLHHAELRDDAEIVVVDNGSSDDTSSVLGKWANGNWVPSQMIFEPRVGKAAALNMALRSARGELLAFTDDDCRLHPEFVNDLLRHNAGDTGLVLRGGRTELGDPTDLPFTINTNPTARRWSLAENSARHANLADAIAGCNMAMRRALVERLGPFDEDFGPGAPVGSGEDTDYLFRAYLDGAIIEYVPDMTVFHHHGRKTPAEGRELFRRYMIGSGALNAKYIRKHPNLCRQTYWDLKHVLREIVTGTNLFLPGIEFSHTDKLACVARGATRYLLMRKSKSAPSLRAERHLAMATEQNPPLSDAP